MDSSANVAITIDNNYAQHACVMLESLRQNNKRSIRVYCIYRDLSKRNIDLLAKCFERSTIKLVFVEFGSANLPELPIKETDHLTATTFYRIWLPEILHEINYVLFLDADIVINGDISYLLDLQIPDYPIAAIEDPGMTIKKKLTLNIPPEQKYFNAGVLKMNLTYFREYRLTEMIADFIAAYPEKCEFHDQDAMNAIFKGRFFSLDFSYNLQWVFYEDRFLNDARFKRAMESPLIIHYSGGGDCKPWFYRNMHPYKRLYYRYLKRTPFRNYLPPDSPEVKGFKKFVKKILSFLRTYQS